MELVVPARGGRGKEKAARVEIRPWLWRRRLRLCTLDCWPWAMGCGLRGLEGPVVARSSAERGARAGGAAMAARLSRCGGGAGSLTSSGVRGCYRCGGARRAGDGGRGALSGDARWWPGAQWSLEAAAALVEETRERGKQGGRRRKKRKKGEKKERKEKKVILMEISLF